MKCEGLMGMKGIKGPSGTLCAMLAAVCWSFSGVLGKVISWNVFSMMGARALIAVLILGVARGSFRVRPTKGTLLGAVSVALTSLLYLFAIRLTTSANAIVLQYSMTAVVILLCWVFYHQRPRISDVVTVAFVMAGVALCSLQSLGNGRLLGDLLALLSAVTFAMVFFCSRMPGANAMDYTYLGNILSSVLVVSVLFDGNVGRKGIDWLYILLLGLSLGGGYYFFSRATDSVSPLVAAVSANVEPVLNPIWVFLFLGENPGWLGIAGAAVVLTTVTVYSLCGNRKRQAE